MRFSLRGPIIRAASYLLIAAMSALLVMLAFGETFAFILEPLGLYNEKGGIYTDCSDPRNAKHKFCEPPEPAPSRAWRSDKNPVPFSLTEGR